jgi:hypothetical protein
MRRGGAAGGCAGDRCPRDAGVEPGGHGLYATFDGRGLQSICCFCFHAL